MHDEKVQQVGLSYCSGWAYTPSHLPKISFMTMNSKSQIAVWLWLEQRVQRAA